VHPIWKKALELNVRTHTHTFPMNKTIHTYIPRCVVNNNLRLSLSHTHTHTHTLSLQTGGLIVTLRGIE